MEHRGCVSILRNGHRPKPCFFGWEPHGSRSEARSSSDHLARKRQRTDNNCSVSCFSGRRPAGGKQSADGAAKHAAHDLRRRRVGDLFGNRLSRGSGKPRGDSRQDSGSGRSRRGKASRRVKGRAQFRFHFTSLVFANNYVTPIDGALQSLPGNAKVRTQDAEGTIEPVDQIDPDVAALAEGAAGGFVLGSGRGGRIQAARSSSIGPWLCRGGALGKILFTAGNGIQPLCP